MDNLSNDIKRYLNGEMTSSERHALERKALSDPFLADALEGASTINVSDFNTDLGSLNKRLGERISSSGKGAGFSWRWPLRIAAGLLILAAASFVVNRLLENTDGTNQIVLNRVGEPKPSDLEEQGAEDEANLENREVEQPITPSPSEKPTVVEQPTPPLERKSRIRSEPTMRSETTPEKKKEEVESEKVGESDGNGELGIALTPSVIVSDTVNTNAFSYSSLSKEEGNLATDNVARTKGIINLDDATISSGPSSTNGNRRAAAPAAMEAAPVVAVHTIKGKVTDQDDGIPIPGVNVHVKGTVQGTVTDLNGNYELTVPVGNEALVFSYIGMETKELAPTTETLDVQLVPEVGELSEVVVVGYESDEEQYEGTKWELAEPEGGRKEYKKYLEQNLTYPELAVANNVEGKVTIQFTIQPTGQLTDFRIVRSVGYGCDEEVIRLITEGPKWSPTKRNDEPVKGRGKVKMRFSLTDKKRKR